MPCYNEEECLEALYSALSDMREKLATQGCKLYMLLVDNGSTDRTLPLIKEKAAQDSSVLYLSLSRNCQKEGALYAGLEHARTDYVAIMDADLQDPPELLLEMVEIISQGSYDRVGSYLANRDNQSQVYASFAHLFYSLLNKMAGLDIVQGARDYSVMTKRFVDAVLACKERCRFSKGIFCYVGFETKWLPYESIDRIAGQAKWSFIDRTLYAVDSIIAYSTVPLHCITFVGVLLSMLSLLFLLFILIREALFRTAGAGWPSLICIILFLGGIILLAIGVLGQYLSKIYQEVKQRPVYIVTENKTMAQDEPFYQ